MHQTQLSAGTAPAGKRRRGEMALYSYPTRAGRPQQQAGRGERVAGGATQENGWGEEESRKTTRCNKQGEEHNPRTRTDWNFAVDES